MQGKSRRVIVELVSQPEPPQVPAPAPDEPAEPADTRPPEPAGRP